MLQKRGKLQKTNKFKKNPHKKQFMPQIISKLEETQIESSGFFTEDLIVNKCIERKHCKLFYMHQSERSWQDRQRGTNK